MTLGYLIVINEVTLKFLFILLRKISETVIQFHFRLRGCRSQNTFPGDNWHTHHFLCYLISTTKKKVSGVSIEMRSTLAESILVKRSCSYIVDVE